MNITVVGLGKIGLPLAVQFAAQGHTVLGADVKPDLVDLVNQGAEPFPGEAELGQRLAAAVDAGRLRATLDTVAAVAASEAVVVVVPLHVDADGVPDYRTMEAATRSIGAGLHPGVLVSYETTLPVGTTRDRWKPLLEEVSGLVEGRDFHVVFSPERVLTGRIFADLRKYPKLIGGLSPQGGRRAREFYESVLDFDERRDLSRANGVWPMGSAEAAEMAKLAETTYRDVNIALANQFAKFADKQGIDVYAVIEACNSQPYSHIHQPGIAVGGHCIPVYPRLYLSNDPDATIVAAAREANASMPEYAVRQLEDAFGDLSGARVVVLGAAYRGDVKETAFSGVFPLVEALRSRRAHALVHDPMFTDEELQGYDLEPYHMGEPVDAAIVQANHSEYAQLGPAALPGVRAFLEGRSVTDPVDWAGVVYMRLGDVGAL